MPYRVDFGPNTNSETFETMEEIEEWLDEYIIQHLQHGEDFEKRKKQFIDNQIEEVINYKEMFNPKSVYAELEAELNGLEPYTTEYYEEEKRASHIILKKWGGA